MNNALQNDPRRGRYYAELDGLRAVAALMVMLFHLSQAGVSIPGPVTFGQTGVDLFFVLSGFLITSILLRATPGDWSEVRTFYIRRSLRIFPLYFGYLLMSSLLGDIPSWQYWVYLQNFANAFNVPVSGPNHFWSLAVEEQFYVGWPFLVLFSPRRLLVPALSAMICFSAGLRFLLGAQHISIFYLTFTRLDGLAAGAFVAVAHADKRLDSYRRLLMFSTVVLFFAMVLVGMSFRNSGSIWFHVFKYLITSGFYASLIATLLIGAGSAASRFLRASWLRFIGRISYGLYVFHPAIFAFCLSTHFPSAPEPIKTALAVGAAFGVSIASWFGFERYFIRLKDKFAPEPGSVLRAVIEIRG